MVNKFADDNKLVVNTLEDMIRIPNDFDALKKYPEINWMMFNKDKYSALHLGQNNQMHKCKLRKKWLGSSIAEKYLGAIGLDCKLSQKDSIVAGKN